MTGNEILARCLKRYGVEDLFFLMGGPMVDCENACEAEGIRMIDFRHEQAAAMAAHAYSRLRRFPGVCMAASGPGTTNLVTGVANAWADSAPVIAIGGSSPVSQVGMLAFQETDQVAIFKPITRWAERCYDTRRIPALFDMAWRMASAGRPGPVYLDMPGDVLYRDVPEAEIRWLSPPATRPRPAADPHSVELALGLLAAAKKPVLIYGSGVHWSSADEQLRAFVERAGMPFWATPQGRGVIPEDHALSFPAARSPAFRECDLIFEVGTRQSYVIDFARPPRWSADAKLIQLDLDPGEIGRNRTPDAALVGDAAAVLGQLVEAADGRLAPERYSGWVSTLSSLNQEKALDAEKRMSTGGTPIHPLRLCKEVRDWLPHDAVLVVDGQEILNYARQSIPFYEPLSLNSGPYGCMGVGLPFGLGAKLAMPQKTVVVLNGDGSFGLNAMEMDTAVRHDLPVIVIVSVNGGWTAKDRYKAGRELGDTRYDRIFESLGCHAEHVEDAADLRGAIERAAESGKPAVINVRTDPTARAQTVAFANYST